jgi:hypothetical protein
MVVAKVAGGSAADITPNVGPSSQQPDSQVAI